MLIDSQPDMSVVGEASDGELAAGRVVELLPDVAVLDVSMPRMGGVAAAGRIRREAPGVRILALTAHQDAGYARQMIEAGALGFVAKVAAADDLVRAIRTVASGASFVDAALAGRRAEPIPGEGAPARGELTDPEVEVLRRLALGHTARGVASALGADVQAVEAHKARGMGKLGLKSRAELARYAVKKGWLPEE